MAFFHPTVKSCLDFFFAVSNQFQCGFRFLKQLRSCLVIGISILEKLVEIFHFGF